MFIAKNTKKKKEKYKSTDHPFLPICYRLNQKVNRPDLHLEPIFPVKLQQVYTCKLKCNLIVAFSKPYSCIQQTYLNNSLELHLTLCLTESGI